MKFERVLFSIIVVMLCVFLLKECNKTCEVEVVHVDRIIHDTIIKPVDQDPVVIRVPVDSSNVSEEIRRLEDIIASYQDDLTRMQAAYEGLLNSPNQDTIYLVDQVAYQATDTVKTDKYSLGYSILANGPILDFRYSISTFDTTKVVRDKGFMLGAGLWVDHGLNSVYPSVSIGYRKGKGLLDLSVNRGFQLSYKRNLSW